MKVEIATAPCSWGVWYADGTPSGTPYTTFLNQAHEAGYKALELGPAGYLPTDALKLKEELTARSLYICAGTACYSFMKSNSISDLRSEIDKLCGLLVQLDAGYLVTMDDSDVGRFSEKKKDMTRDERLKYINIIRDMTKIVRDQYGIKVVFHPHIKTLYEYEDEIVELMDLANVDLCFDTGHHVYSNGGITKGDRSALDFMLRYHERIAYLHFKNMNGAIRKHVIDGNLDSDQAFDIDVMCDLEDGIIDFKELKTVLDSINFNGIGVIEQDMPRATTEQAFASAKRNLDYLREVHII